MTPGMQTKVVVVTDDAALDEMVRATFGGSAQIGLDVIRSRPADRLDSVDVADATVVVVDADAGEEADLEALERFMTRIGNWPAVVAVTQSFDPAVARRLVQMRVADFLVKPLPPIELVRACARVAKSPVNTEATEAQIFTFLPAVGGAGVTTLAVQTGMLLLNSGTRG